MKISPFLESIVSNDQAAAIKNRTIQNHNHYIRDIITLAHDRGDTNCILSLDQQKAFDRVSHDWLLKVLEANNFGPKIIKWIQILYLNATSKVIINGTLSNAFCLGRGVRQGDPLSMLLYVLTLEPLLECIRQDTDIDGIHTPNGKTQKLLAFADDTNFFPGKHLAVRKIIKHFELFGKCSGSKVNLDKSKGMIIGKGGRLKTIKEVTWVDRLKMFGIIYKNSRDPIDKQAWGELIKEIEIILDKFRTFDTTIFGRANIVNTLVEPKLIYLAHVDTPHKKITKKYNTLVRNFIFTGTISAIRHTTLIQDKRKGGINLHDLDSKLKSIRLKTTLKIIQDTHYTIAHYYISGRIRNHIKYDNTKPHFFGTLPPFYKHLVKTIKQHTDILSLNPKKFYDTLVTQLATPLHEQVKRSPTDIDPNTLFKDLHNNTHISQTQKNITYRLLFGITPTTEGYKRKTNQIYHCKFCKLKQETEEHIYYTCTALHKLKIAFLKLLRIANYTNRDLYRLIFLGLTTPNLGRDIRRYRQTLAQLYRDTIWYGRVDAQFKKQNITDNALRDIFLAKAKHYIETKVDLHTLAKL